MLDDSWRTPSPERPLDQSSTTVPVGGPISARRSESEGPTINPDTSRLSPEEVKQISRQGAGEILGLELRSIRLRQIAIGFASVAEYSKQIGLFEDEKNRLVESINELRYDKHSLLEDNTALRHHNEALIETLEVTNINFEKLSLQLDQMRLGRMVRVISKMMEMPLLDALMIFKQNAGILSP